MGRSGKLVAGRIALESCVGGKQAQHSVRDFLAKAAEELVVAVVFDHRLRLQGDDRVEQFTLPVVRLAGDVHQQLGHELLVVDPH